MKAFFDGLGELMTITVGFAIALVFLLAALWPLWIALAAMKYIFA